MSENDNAAGREPVSDARVEEIFNLADEIMRAPSRFTKDFVVAELVRGVAELAGATERARAALAAATARAEQAEARIAALADELARLATSGVHFWGNDFSQAAEQSRGRRDAYRHAASLARAAAKPAADSTAVSSAAEFVETLRPQFKTLAQLTAEQGVQPVTDINELTAAPEDRLSGEEFETWTSALREARRGDQP